MGSQDGLQLLRRDLFLERVGCGLLILLESGNLGDGPGPVG